MQQLKHNIIKIADEIESEGHLEMYWDYRDELSEEQVLKIIKEEDGLNDVQNELYDWNVDYISEIIQEHLKEGYDELTEDERDELRMECESRFNLNIKGLIHNSKANIRVELYSNEDMIMLQDANHSGTLKDFRRRFMNKFRIKDLNDEINNCTCDYALITFYFKISGEDILRLREEIQNGFITLRKGLHFGLFNSFVGSGSILEIGLLHNVKLNLKDWRLKDDKEAVIQRIEGNDNKYYKVGIRGDNIAKYGIQQVYGLCSWQEW